MDYQFKDNISFLLGNITPKAISIKKGQQIARALLLSLNTYVSIHHVGTMSDMGLEDDPDLQSIALEDLLNEFLYIFASHDHDFGEMHDTIHSIDVGDSKPFKSRPYHKSIVEEQVVSKELKNLLDAGLLKPSKSHWASPLIQVKKM